MRAAAIADVEQHHVISSAAGISTAPAVSSAIHYYRVGLVWNDQRSKAVVHVDASQFEINTSYLDRAPLSASATGLVDESCSTLLISLAREQLVSNVKLSLTRVAGDNI